MSYLSSFDNYNIHLINFYIKRAKQYANKIENTKLESYNLITQKLNQSIQIFELFKKGDIKINQKTLDRLKLIRKQNEFQLKFRLPNYKIYENKVNYIILILHNYFKLIYKKNVYI